MLGRSVAATVGGVECGAVQWVRGSVAAAAAAAQRRRLSSPPLPHGHTVNPRQRNTGDLETLEQRRAALDAVAAALGVGESAKEWRRVTNAQFVAAGGGRLLARYGASLGRLLAHCRGLGPDCRRSVPRRHWDARPHRVAFVEDFARAQGIETAKQWQAVRREALYAAGGRGLLKRYGGSVGRLLEDTLPEAMGGGRLRPKRSNGFWKSAENRRSFLEELGRRLGLREPEEWAAVSAATVQRMGGSGLLRHCTLAQALQELHPSLSPAEVARCRPSAAVGRWESREEALAVLEEARELFGLEQKEDWYRLSHKHFALLRAGGLLRRWPLLALLRRCFPAEHWREEEAASSHKRASQHLLRFQLRRLLGPGLEVLEEHRAPAMRDAAGRAALELDLFVPALNLAFEYQGLHHYEEVAIYGATEQYARRDARKRRLCEESGVRLVEVPCWWDDSLESLAATIHRQYPGVLEDVAGRKEAAQCSS